MYREVQQSKYNSEDNLVDKTVVGTVEEVEKGELLNQMYLGGVAPHWKKLEGAVHFHWQEV